MLRVTLLTRFVVLFLTVCWTTIAGAVIVSTTSKDLRDSRALNQSELMRMLNQQQFSIHTDYLGQFYTSPPLKSEAQDSQALALIFKLLQDKDSRVPVAIANYIRKHPTDLNGFYLAALNLLEQKKYSQAEQALTKITASKPTLSAAHTLQGLARFAQGKFSEGYAAFKAAIVQPEPDLRAYPYLIWYAIRRGQSEAATAFAEKQVVTLGTSEVSLAALELSEVYRLFGKHQENSAFLSSVLANSNPPSSQQYVEAIVRLVESLSLQGRVKETKKWLKEIIDEPGYESIPAIFARSRIAALEEKPEQGLKLLSNMEVTGAALERQRLALMAKLYLVDGKQDEARETLMEYEKQLPLPPVLSDVQEYTSLMVLAGAGNSALDWVKGLIKTLPEAPAYRLLYAELLYKAGDVSTAQKELAVLLNDFTEFSAAWYTKGIWHYGEGNNEQAKSAFREAVKAEPEKVSYWLALVGAMHDHREHQHAEGTAAIDHKGVLPIFDEALKYNPNSYALLYEKGITAYSGSQLDIAKKAFSRARELSPLFVSAIAMEAITNADLNIDLEVSKERLIQSESLSPGNPAIIDALGWVETRSNNYAKAEEYYERALTMMPNDGAILAHKSINAFSKGDKIEARKGVLAALKETLPDHITDELRAVLIEVEPSTSKTLPIHKINNFGVGRKIGNVTLTQVEGAVEVSVSSVELDAGEYGMHFHERPSCAPGMKGKDRLAGLSAGNHYGHGSMDMSSMSAEQHKMHMAMMKPKGDLPTLVIPANGEEVPLVMGMELTLDELRGRSMMIHDGPDVDGVSGPKIACVVID